MADLRLWRVTSNTMPTFTPLCHLVLAASVLLLDGGASPVSLRPTASYASQGVSTSAARTHELTLSDLHAGGDAVITISGVDEAVLVRLELQLLGGDGTPTWSQRMRALCRREAVRLR